MFASRIEGARWRRWRRWGAALGAAAILAVACAGLEPPRFLDVTLQGFENDNLEATWGNAHIDLWFFSFSADDLHVQSKPGAPGITGVDVVVWADANDNGEFDSGEDHQTFSQDSSPPTSSFTLTNLNGSLSPGASNVKYQVTVETQGGGKTTWGGSI